jgi:hypothetical protein
MIKILLLRKLLVATQPGNGADIEIKTFEVYVYDTICLILERFHYVSGGSSNSHFGAQIK